MNIPELTNSERILMSVNTVSILLFSLLALNKENYEFVLYISVIVLFFAFFFIKRRRFNLPAWVLWLLTGWSLLHMAGGLLTYDGVNVLYNLVLVPLVSEPYDIFKYDQFVHAYGFFTTTLLLYHIYRDRFREIARFSSILLLVAAACGFGAFNEIVEFTAVVAVPETNVGGYTNTALDLCFNLFGATLASITIALFIHPKPTRSA